MNNNYPMTHPLWLNKYSIGGIYDGYINMFVSVDNEEYSRIMRYMQNRNDTFTTLEKYCSIGFFNENSLNSRVDDSICNVNHVLSNSEHRAIPRKLTLELTGNCNLRCKYCRYTQNMKRNEGRFHNNTVMDFDTASIAIIKYLETYLSIKQQIPDNMIQTFEQYSQPIIGLYGGEVLLCKDLLIKLVKFIHIQSKKLKLNTKIAITTNGTLLDADIIAFLVKKNIYLAISLDGPQSENDKNRITPMGSGTFQIVNKWLDYLLEIYPKYTKEKVTIQAVDYPGYDKDSVLEFFNSKTQAQNFAGVNNVLMLSYTDFSEDKNPICTNINLEELQHNLDILIENHDLFFSSIKSSLSTKDIIIKIKTNPFINGILQYAFEIERKISNKPRTILNYFNSCYIARANLFVSTNGEYHICERTDFSMPIGNVHDGIDSMKLRSIYSRYFSIMNRVKCRSCWCGLFCNLCIGQTLYKNNITSPNDNKCEQIKLMADHALKLLILLSNRHPHVYIALDEYFKNTDYITIDEFMKCHYKTNYNNQPL